MRLESLIAIALVFPSAAFAQGGGTLPQGVRPDATVPLSPQPEIVARASDMLRSRVNRALGVPKSRYSFETYPLLSRMVEPAFSNDRPAASFNIVGAGTQVDYRFMPFLSATAAVTTSSAGSARAETAELGLRLHPVDLDARIRPFADARVGYQRSYDAPPGSQVDLGFGSEFGVTDAARESRGYGAIVGAGAEYSLTRTFALLTGLSAMRSGMRVYFDPRSAAPTPGDLYHMTTYRLAFGIRYNPVFRRSDGEQ